MSRPKKLTDTALEGVIQALLAIRCSDGPEEYMLKFFSQQDGERTEEALEWALEEQKRRKSR